MKTFARPEHETIVETLRLMDRRFLLGNRCWFGGGTAIVLKYGEYRVSLDVDFLCSDPAGYRELRTAATRLGHRAFFPATVEAIREFKIDQYGLRTAVRFKGQPIKFEIIREARVDLDGFLDADIGVPTLTVSDMFAEKLLANADRCQDRSTACRDALDLGILVLRNSGIPGESVSKAELAYGSDIGRKVRWVTDHLLSAKELGQAAAALSMDLALAGDAIAALRNEGRRLWPDVAV
jgi:hypothetical protein